MSEHSRDRLELSDEEVRDLLRSLRHKDGNWIAWGKACHQLHKAGYDPNNIFEETGFEAAVQNQVIVAAQVYDSIVEVGVSDRAKAYSEGPHSDVLYEFRLLNRQQRSAAVELAAEKQFDVDDAHSLTRDMKLTSRLSNLPEGFTSRPGDAVAYQCWRQARQKKDLAERTRLIARGLKFVQTDGARQQLEKLLSEISAPPKYQAPRLPFYRLEQEDELPRLVPVAGEFPLSASDIETLSPVTAIEPFRITTVPPNTACIPVPGWQVVLRAADPVAVLTRSTDLPNAPEGRTEQVVVVVDRAVRAWNPNSYFLVETGDTVDVAWFDEAPAETVLGQVVLILRPKRILDEGHLIQPWQMDD
ncbi:RuBisCO accumulation factor 1 [Baaleninema simplex]|uniref:RuBisCO accumulation factor 1 n=1 Tax=Baaleninema simplex TaxID=2862350 RepID=UPI000346EF22|nr:RuBisCO accumulation factor 1 [Baaleninema simplex]